jgi:periplasmic divalent cation tolerance protein
MPRSSDYLVTLVTAPDDATASTMAATLVGEGLAGCVNIVPAIRSVYRWKGEVMEEPETMMIFKTTRARFDALAARIEALHPYETPEIIALPIEAGARRYLDWLGACVALEKNK